MGIPEAELLPVKDAPRAAEDLRQLECPICHEVFLEPVSCKACRQSFCRGCAAGEAERSGRCATCRQPVQKEDFKPCVASVFLLDRLHVLCQHSTSAVAKCGWSGRLDSRRGHLLECPVVLLERRRQEYEAALTQLRAENEAMVQRDRASTVQLLELREELQSGKAQLQRLASERDDAQSGAQALRDLVAQFRKASKALLPKAGRGKRRHAPGTPAAASGVNGGGAGPKAGAARADPASAREMVALGEKWRATPCEQREAFLTKLPEAKRAELLQHLLTQEVPVPKSPGGGTRAPPTPPTKRPWAAGAQPAQPHARGKSPAPPGPKAKAAGHPRAAAASSSPSFGSSSD